MAQASSHAADLFGKWPKSTITDEVRWSRTQHCLLRKGWQAGQLVWIPFEPPANPAPFRTRRAGIRQMLSVSTIADKARQASAVPEARRTGTHRMEIAVWNLTWRCFKSNYPALADMLSSDFVAQAKATFNASIEIDLEVFNGK